MPFFRYFADKSDNAPASAVSRVVAAYARPYILALQNHTEAPQAEGKTPEETRFEMEADGKGPAFKWIEVEFKTWWENAVAPDSKVLWTEGADAGEFWAEVVDPATGNVVTIACSTETGEPVEEDAEEARGEEAVPVEETAPAAETPVTADAEPKQEEAVPVEEKSEGSEEKA